MERKTLFEISVNDISPNPHNPRLIFDAYELLDLKKSIEKVGILVPLTVYENTKKFPPTKYILLDGERRWRCAKEIGLDKVPANIIDEPKDVTQNILFMFNIHHFRKEWPLFPTALKLEVLIKQLQTDSESVISEFTGLTRSTIRRCLKLLWYPAQYRDILMSKGGKISTDFFIELYPVAHRLSQEEKYNYPDGLTVFVNGMINKFQKGDILTDVKEFREIRKSMAYYEKANSFEDFNAKINRFISEPNTGIDIFASPDIENDKLRVNILKYLGYLNANLKETNPELLSDLYVVEQLKNLKNILDELIEKID